jgi:hypothetical protein
VSFFDKLLGTSKPVASKTEGLFAISTAVVTFQVSLHLEPSKEAAICFKSVEALRFEEMQRDISDLLAIRAKDTGTLSQMRAFSDTLGFQWAMIRTEEFEDLVTTVHMVSEELRSRGYGDRLYSAVFKFVGEGQNVYWMYNYKRGKWYPFVPKGEGARDNPYELRLSSLMSGEMPIEKELEYWYPMWGMPV